MPADRERTKDRQGTQNLSERAWARSASKSPDDFPDEENAAASRSRGAARQTPSRDMKVHDVMSPDVEVARPDDSIQEIAVKMGRLDVGVIPVCDTDRLVGVLTDRDIALRVIGQGRGPDTKVRDVMTPEVEYCFDDEQVSHVSQNMAELKVRRLPVVNREKRLVGILSLGDIAGKQDPDRTGLALRGVSRPGGPHAQAAHAGTKPTLAGSKPTKFKKPRHR
jgi:CBS domain-containing protein